MKTQYLFVILCFFIYSHSVSAKNRIYDMSSFGLKADSKVNASPFMQKALLSIKNECKKDDRVIIKFPKGRYDFHEEGSMIREYYISNHDQNNPKKVGIAIENLNNVTIDGQGSIFIFHGRMLPIAILNSNNCRIKNLNIDFENPHISQIKIINNDPEKGITFETAPWVHYQISKDTTFEVTGENWKLSPPTGIAFENKTRHLVYQTSDLGINTKGITEISPRILNAPAWKDSRLIPGTIVAMRTYERPAPGIFLSNNKNTTLKDVRIHYAEGMGLLAQLCENITLNGFSVCLKGDKDPRYFTTQADATHFSGCKGKILSTHGLYEGMMDDAINVHGTYLKVIKRIDNTTLVGKYMHNQTWGFDWGYEGDSVQFINSRTMELAGNKNKIANISPYDQKSAHGAKEFIISFENPIDTAINETSSFGIENLEWTPEVVFSHNIIRNNRARGALFSTPQPVVVENNLFDHTSGTAILLCGDCNGWYETGACRKVLIRKNIFINALTNMFQFTNAIISIYPEIPELDKQQKYFHGGPKEGIIIEKNLFKTFDTPILYAKSIDGITFKDNRIEKTFEYPAFHWNKHRFLFEKVKNISIKNNTFEEDFDYSRDVKEK